MRIQHRVSLNSTPRISAELAELGIATGPANELASRMITFTVDEDQPSWPRIAHLIDSSGAVDVVTTKFTRKEIDQASYLELEPTWHHGYPQPEDDFGYLNSTYDLSDYCATCGIGARQKSSFQMSGEPKWGRKSILQLNWVFDEFFVTPSLWRAVFEPAGIERLPVLGNDGDKLTTVVQLVVAGEVDVSGLAGENCSTCGRIKYPSMSRGFFPAVVGEPASLARTIQHFGSGASAFRPIIARQAIVSALFERGVRGVSARPVAQ